MEQQGCLPQAPDMPRPLHASTPLSCPLCLGSVSNPEVLPGGRSLGPCPNCGHTMTFDPMVDPEVRVTFKVNGEQHTVPNIYDATMSLNEYLREVAHLPGTKVMCREGGCGCCVVTATHFDPLQKRNKTIAVNSCLCLVYAIDGWEITTTEGIGSQRKGFHAIQARIADYSGSQCGFCTPGMVMNMYSLLSEAPRPSKRQVEDSLDGNICRCTGFRPILDAFKSFSPEADPIDLPGGPIDIEDLAKHGCSGSAEACEGQGQCRGEGHCQISRSPRSLSLTVTGGQWYRPTSLANLYTLLGQLQGRKYRLVYGNTSMGVYKNDGPFDVFINIKAVPELYRVKVLDEVKEHQGFGYCGRLADHMRRVANVPVRNAGCWAGNMMMKHMHKDFPSDVFIVMETVGAMIQIGGEDDVCEVSPSDFLKLDMHQKVIETLLLPKLDDREYVRTYKVMPRSQNAHAYVNAGFRVQLDTTQKVTGRPTVVFGGISASFVHAKATEQYLLNRSLSDDHTPQEALKLLQDELIPDRNPVLASATYRRDLAVSLFYKFILDVSGEKVSSRLKSGATILKRPVSSGKQEYGTDKSKWPLTKPMPNVSSKLQASGEAQYVCDLPLLPGELHAAFVLTTQGNATIATVDTSTALRSPGVVRYLGATDIPSSGANNFAAVGSQPEELFCSGKVLYAGQAVGIIIADTQLHADDAAIKVQISYKDVQPPILTIEEAIKKKSFFPPPGPVLKKGDAEKAIKSSDKTIAGTISMGTQYHFTMETQGCRVVPTEDGFDVQATTQWVDTVQSSIAQVLGIKNSHVCVQVKRLGGAYGAKISRNNQIATACGLAASTLNRPVRMSLNLQTNMEMVGKRFPYLAEYEVGVSTQGKLNGIKITYYTDCGCSPNDNAVMGAIDWADNAYFCLNWRLEGKLVRTNTPSHTFTRSPGSVPSIFITESIMEHVAEELTMDPLELKTTNLYHKDQVTHLNQPLPYCNIRSLVPQLMSSANTAERKSQAKAFNQANRWKKRGMSTVPMKYGILWTGAYYNVLISVYNSDGSVAISHGGVEMGQGINTKVMQVCAEKLGIDMSMVTIRPTSDLPSANSQSSGGSTTSEQCALGVQKCCEDLTARMAPVKEHIKDPSWPELVQACFQKGIDLSARYWVYPTTKYPFQYQSYGVTCTEVELDVLTGESQVVRVDILYDCGQSMNPLVDVGQVEGAFVMGLGNWRSEQIKYDPTSGSNLTTGTWEYKPPASQDIPVDFRISLLKDAPNPLGVLRSKAVGEPPQCMACSVLFALKHAIEAARTDLKRDAYFRLDGPATPEVTKAMCLPDISQYVLK